MRINANDDNNDDCRSGGSNSDSSGVSTVLSSPHAWSRAGRCRICVDLEKLHLAGQLPGHANGDLGRAEHRAITAIEIKTSGTATVLYKYTTPLSGDAMMTTELSNILCEMIATMMVMMMFIEASVTILRCSH